MFKFDLPIPSSTNTAYADKRNGAGRVKSAQARKSTTDILTALQPHLIENKRHCDMTMLSRMCAGGGNPGIILKKYREARPSYAVSYTFHFKDDDRPRDLANFEKILTDTLVNVGFLLDDQFIDVMTLRRGPCSKLNPRVYVEIEIR